MARVVHLPCVRSSSFHGKPQGSSRRTSAKHTHTQSSSPRQPVVRHRRDLARQQFKRGAFFRGRRHGPHGFAATNYRQHAVPSCRTRQHVRKPPEERVHQRWQQQQQQVWSRAFGWQPGILVRSSGRARSGQQLQGKGAKRRRQRPGRLPPPPAAVQPAVDAAAGSRLGVERREGKRWRGERELSQKYEQVVQQRQQGR